MSSISKYFSLLPVLLGAPLLAAQETIDFKQQIEPILKENCLKCHGPKKEESDFRVDRKSSLFGGGGSGIETILPGNPAGQSKGDNQKGSDNQKMTWELSGGARAPDPDSL
jgi:hypothetical protein